MQTIQSVAFIGMGALGILYSHTMAEKMKEGAVTFLVDEKRKQRYHADPPTFNGEPCRFAFCDPQDYPGKAQLLIFGVKGTQLKEAIESVRPVVGPETIIVSLLNGITSETILEEAFPQATVLYSVAQGMAATRVGTHVTCKNPGFLFIGVPARYADRLPALKTVEAFFDSTGVVYRHEEDIERRIWCKWMFNIGVNQTIAVAKGTFADIQKPGPVRDRYIDAMREVVAVAEKVGVDVTERDLEEYIRIGDRLDPEGMPSLRQDTKAHRLTEVDFFSGALIEKAKAVGVPVPVNEALNREIKAIEASWKQVDAPVVDLLCAHTSVRDYTDEPVSEAMRQKILDAVFAASSSCFLQLVTVIRVTDPELRRVMYEASGNQPQVLSAPEFWVFCADYHRDAGLCPKADLGWTEQFLTSTLDVGICVQNAMVALESLELGGCFIGGLRNDIAKADQALGLPENVYPVLGLAFGHPAFKNEVKPRLPQAITVMENRYVEPNVQELKAYDVVTGNYFATRSRSPRKDSWTKGIGGVLERERRPFVLEFLRSKGFAAK